MPKGGIPQEYSDLFEKRTFASLATLMPEGSPQVTPVWCDFDGTHILINTAKGRQKHRNLSRDPRVALAMMDPDNPYRYLEVRGEVEAMTEEGAWDHAHKMAKKYLDQDKYPYAQPGEVRLLIKIKPQHYTAMG